MTDVVLRVFGILLETASMVVGNADWMTWNLVLALIPMYLAHRLFRRPSRSVGRPLWWLGVAAFVFFLPNAPYVLTDLIHIPRDAAAANSYWHTAFVTVPMYAAFCAIGFGAYVVSLIWLGRMLHGRGWTQRSVAGVEIGLHAATAAGIYLGRFVRFNSWDIVLRPHEVALTVADAFSSIGPLAFTAVFFVATCALYWPSKHLIIAVVCYVRSGALRASPALVQRYM